MRVIANNLRSFHFVHEQRASDDTEWTIFWLSRKIGHENTWNTIWDNMSSDERAFNVINPEMVCDGFVPLIFDLIRNLMVSIRLTIKSKRMTISNGSPISFEDPRKFGSLSLLKQFSIGVLPFGVLFTFNFVI